MKIKCLLLVCLLSISIMCQVGDTLIWMNKDTTSTFVITFNEDMNPIGIQDVENYSIVDITSLNECIIYGIGIVLEQGGQIITGNKMIGIITKRVDYKKTYKITVNNISDVSNNVIDSTHNFLYYYFSGYEPNIVGTPSANLGK